MAVEWYIGFHLVCFGLLIVWFALGNRDRKPECLCQACSERELVRHRQGR